MLKEGGMDVRNGSLSGSLSGFKHVFCFSVLYCITPYYTVLYCIIVISLGLYDYFPYLLPHYKY